MQFGSKTRCTKQLQRWDLTCRPGTCSSNYGDPPWDCNIAGLFIATCRVFLTFAIYFHQPTRINPQNFVNTSYTWAGLKYVIQLDTKKNVIQLEISSQLSCLSPGTKVAHQLIRRHLKVSCRNCKNRFCKKHLF